MRFIAAFKSGLCLLLAVAVQSGSAMTLYMSMDEDDGHAYIIANDAMLKAEDAVKIRRFLNIQAIRAMPTAIFITSPGGFGELMSQFAKAIVEPSNELYRKHGLFNLLIVNDECSSACVILMSQITNTRNHEALKMMVAVDAKFGFHSPVEMRNGMFTNIRDQIERETRIRLQIGLLAAAGVNPEWLKKNDEMLRSSEMTFLTGAQLCAGNSNILSEESCVSGVNDLGTLARNRLNLAVDAMKSARVRPNSRGTQRPSPLKPKKPVASKTIPKPKPKPVKRSGAGFVSF